MLVQKASDLTSESTGLQQRTHAAGIVEEVPAQLGRQYVPLHDERGPEAAQDVILFVGKS